MVKSSLVNLVSEVRQCTLCELGHGHNPVVQLDARAKILIAGQAPGAKVHETGIPFDDPSGNRLREWLGVSSEQFYDAGLLAILPMAFCYPGKGKSGDLPPDPRCAQQWRQPLLDQLPGVQLTLVIGQYAKAWHLPSNKMNITEAARAWQTFPDGLMVLPHPSPRNNIWLKKNPWFEADVVPELRRRVRLCLDEDVT